MLQNLLDQAYSEYIVFLNEQRKNKCVTLSNGTRLFFYVGLLCNLMSYKQKNSITHNDIVIFCEMEVMTKSKFSRITGIK